MNSEVVVGAVAVVGAIPLLLPLLLIPLLLLLILYLSSSYLVSNIILLLLHCSADALMKLVENACSDMLISPDWTLNMRIVDDLNRERDPVV